MNSYILYFSPTGRTYAVAEAFTSAWPDERLWVDIGSRDIEPERLHFDSRTVCVIATPCFSDHIPEFVTSRLDRMRGNGAAAVLIVTSSGQWIGDALCELQETAQDADFFVHAVMHAAAQHPLCTEAAAGRPHEKDAYELSLFGQLVRDFPQLRAEPLTLPSHSQPTEKTAAAHLTVRADFRCDNCGVCFEACPVDAIPEAHPSRTDKDKCIACMQCAAVCPQNARHLCEVDKVAVRQRLLRAGTLNANHINTLYLRQLGALQEPEVSS